MDAFCNKIILARQAFFETRYFYALCDIKPLLPGESLIVPKRHMLFITQLNDKEFMDLRLMLRRMLPRLLKAYGADSYNVIVNAKRNAGMAVPHLHLHIIPRTSGDAFHPKWALDLYEMVRWAEKIKKKDIHSEVVRLRKIFKYEPRP